MWMGMAGITIGLIALARAETKNDDKEGKEALENQEKFGPRGVDESGTSADYKAGKTGKADKGGSLSVRFSKDGKQPNLSNGAPYTTAIGYEAAGKNITGQKSTFVGAYSGYEATSGEKNTGLGYKSLYANTTGKNNVGIGYEAGNKFTSGDNNLLVGYAAMKNESGAANNRIVIGGRTYNGKSDNTMVLGNSSLTGSTVIYGSGITLVKSDGKEKLEIPYAALKALPGTTATALATQSTDTFKKDGDDQL